MDQELLSIVVLRILAFPVYNVLLRATSFDFDSLKYYSSKNCLFAIEFFIDIDVWKHELEQVTEKGVTKISDYFFSCNSVTKDVDHV